MAKTGAIQHYLVQQTIWSRHARLMRSGKPMRCVSPGHATAEERVRRNGGIDKIIFNSRKAAEAAIADLAKLYPEQMRAYECPYSRSGHYHLATERDDA